MEIPASGMKFVASFSAEIRLSSFYPEEGCNRILRNVSTPLTIYMEPLQQTVPLIITARLVTSIWLFTLSMAL
jgi:hypothetical protein